MPGEERGRCKCVIEDANIPFDVGEDDGYVLEEGFCAKSYRRYMDLRLTECYENNPVLGFRMLLMNGLTGKIRSQRRASTELGAYLTSIAPQYRSGADELQTIG